MVTPRKIPQKSRNNTMSLNNIFSKVKQLPQMPQVIQDVMGAFQSDTVNVDAIAKKLAEDPGVTAKILRLANSSHYSGARSVGSVNEAVVIMGFNALRTLVLASGVTTAFKYPASFDARAFWTSSFTVATNARWLAKFGDVDRELAYTTGMLHNIGSIMIAIAEPEAYEKIIKTADNDAHTTMLEQESLGVTAVEVSTELARRWKFPEDITDGLAQYQNKGTDSKMAALIQLAKYIELNASNPDIAENFPLDAARVAGLDVDQLLEHLDELLEMDSGVNDILSMAA